MSKAERYHQIITIKGLSEAGTLVSTQLNLYRFQGIRPGPSLLMTGGVHGDEYEGPLVLSRFAQRFDPNMLAGTLNIVPIMNPPAFRARQRCSPHDGLDLNRSFPGRIDASLTEAIAAWAVSLLTDIDYVLDLHAGGDIEMIVPSVMVHPVTDQLLFERSIQMAAAFAAPVAIVIDEAAKSNMFDTIVENMGKPFLCAELGGGGALTSETVAIAERGVVNILSYLGMIDNEHKSSSWHRWNGTKLLQSNPHDAIESAFEGMYEPACQIGDAVIRGQTVGTLHPFIGEHCSFGAAHEIHAPASGVLFIQGAGGPVPAGLTLCAIGQPYTGLEIAVDPDA